MKFNKNYDEDYDLGFNKKQKSSYVKNNKNNIELSKLEVKNKAEVLMNTKVDNRNILGFKALKDNKEIFIKYDKEQNIYVAYTFNNDIIVCDQRSIRDFNSEKVVYYIDEIV